MSGGATAPWGPKFIELTADSVVIGRSREASILLTHPGVSRQHAELRRVDGHLAVRDLKSRFGVRVNGQRITDEQLLQDGDRIEFGPVTYCLAGDRLKLSMEPDGVRLEVRNLAVVRGGQQRLAGVDLDILPNQFVGILGPSGAGKTSLIKCLATLLSPSAGTMTFDGFHLPAYRETYRSILGYVPQQDIVYESLTVRENLEFSLRLRAAGDLQTAERADCIQATLERLGLTSHAQNLVKSLSGGERKRVNVATELLTQPRLLLLDEPTSGLDPAAETRLMHLFKELAGRGTTVVCSTHVMENLAMFDQVVVIAGQKVIYQGPPGDLLAHFKVASYPALYKYFETQVWSPPPQQKTGAGAYDAEAAGSHVLRGIQTVVPTVPMPVMTGVPRTKLGTQVAVQFLRGLRLICRDPWLLALLIGQPLLVGLLINLSQQRPDGLEPIFMFAVVTSIWLGLNNTAREVVRDRPVYVRERLVGVTPDGYLAAKLLLYGLVGFLQLLLLTLLIRSFNILSRGYQDDLSEWSFAYVLVVLWITYVAAMLLGLLVSTLASSQETAIAALPLIILPQLLLTGVATGLKSAQDGSFRSLAVMLDRTGTGSRGFWRWLLELLSLTAYSRPALALFGRVRVDETRVPLARVLVVDWLHLLFLLGFTATLLVVFFRLREKAWLEQS